jgi:hypothetical protein
MAVPAIEGAPPLSDYDLLRVIVYIGRLYTHELHGPYSILQVGHDTTQLAVPVGSVRFVPYALGQTF